MLEPEIPPMRSVLRTCDKCSASLRVDLAGLGPKTAIGCPDCGDVTRISSADIGRLHKQFARQVKLLRDNPAASSGLPAAKRAAETIAAAKAHPLSHARVQKIEA